MTTDGCHSERSEESLFFTMTFKRFLLAIFLITFFTSSESLAYGETDSVRFDAENKLYRPDNWREWVFVGSQVTPHDMNGGLAYLPEFHYVYIDPESFTHWKKTGVFRNGATFVKELLSVGSKEGMTGNGYFPGEFIGLEVSHKDKNRFPDNPGGWAFFSYGKPPYGKISADLKGDGELDCGGCHARGAEDWVFTEYYSILREERP